VEHRGSSENEQARSREARSGRPRLEKNRTRLRPREGHHIGGRRFVKSRSGGARDTLKKKMVRRAVFAR